MDLVATEATAQQLCCASAAEERRTLRCSGFAWPSLCGLARTVQAGAWQGPIKRAPCLRRLHPEGSGCTLQGLFCVALPLPSDVFATWRAFAPAGAGLDPTHMGSLPEPGFARQEALLPPLRRAALAFTAWRAFGRAG